MTTKPPARAVQWTIFLTLLATYGYFFQGGGWNQNSRFSQIRAIVEQGRLSVNDYLLYRVDRSSHAEPRLLRGSVPPEAPLEGIERVANTGDLSKNEATGRIYPNKPPGAVFLAVPAYWLIHRVEQAAGINPDHWWAQTLSHYLVTALSVGLIGALGCLMFLRVSSELFGECPSWTHAAATLSFGLGTMMLPFSTMLFDHVAVAGLLLLALSCLVGLRRTDAMRGRASLLLLGSGAAVGLAVTTNYLAAVPAIFLLAYALVQSPRRTGVLLFIVGALPFVLVLAWYQQACFGSVFAIATTMQHQRFVEQDLVLGVFRLPRPDVLWKLLFSARRGLFVSSPVLLLGLVGAVLVARERGRRIEAALMVLPFLALWLINASFKNWHGGGSTGPRYLIPALPFLALPLAIVFRRIPSIALTLAAVSVALMLAATAVDGQAPAVVENPMASHVWPLLRGREVVVGDVGFDGPVSANPLGVYESWYYLRFPRGSPQSTWNSFNLGEFLWPGRRSSVAPLIAVLVGATLLLWRWTAPRGS
jgi:hypothetical protein